MTHLTLGPPPTVLAQRLTDQLGPVLQRLGWQHDDLALQLFDAADRVAKYTAAATAPFSPTLRHRYRLRALTAAHDLRHRLDQVHRLDLPDTAGTITQANALLYDLLLALGDPHASLGTARPAARGQVSSC
jgi:hypothetical protein